MVTEWKEFLWDVPEERVALWAHCHTLFIRSSFPALQVCLVYGGACSIQDICYIALFES